MRMKDPDRLIQTRPRHALLKGLAVPVLFVAQTLHWILWCLDEVFFPGYRKESVTEPVFITGVPRSGTTLLLRTLARDGDRFTYCRTSDLIAGPSLCGYALVHGLSALDRKLGGPLRRLFGWLSRPVMKTMGSIHTFDLNKAEEDFVWLWPVNGCFLIFLLFPNSPAAWNLARLDERVAPKARKQILSYYRACLQKKLHREGSTHTYLAKNPSFTLWMESLGEAFPDARWVSCSRDLDEAVASQLSSLTPSLESAGIAPEDPRLRARFTELIEQYEQTGRNPPVNQRHVRVEYTDLKQSLKTVVEQLHRELDLGLSDDFLAQLKTLEEKAAAFDSGHRYEVVSRSDYRVSPPNQPTGTVAPTGAHLVKDSA